MLPVLDYGDGISCVDTGYVRPQMTACYLLEQDGRAAFIETGVNNNVAALLALLNDKGIAREQVDYVIPTHVHLDHAGGAGQLMQALPNAQLVIHPRGARHMIDPARLIAGTSAVYGADEFSRLYGDVIPVDAARVVEAADGFEISLGSRVLQFIDTPGHARHHFCIYDALSQGVFSGDTFGLSYREFDSNGKVLCFPTTTPVQFDPDALHRSIDRLMALQPSQIFLTHFGRIESPRQAADQLHRDIDHFVSITNGAKAENDPQQRISEQLQDWLCNRARAVNADLSAEKIRQLLAADILLNAQGLAYWLRTQH